MQPSLYTTHRVFGPILILAGFFVLWSDEGRANDWIGDGNWDTSSHWSSGHPPTAEETVTITGTVYVPGGVSGTFGTMALPQNAFGYTINVNGGHLEGGSALIGGNLHFNPNRPITLNVSSGTMHLTGELGFGRSSHGNGYVNVTGGLLQVDTALTVGRGNLTMSGTSARLSVGHFVDTNEGGTLHFNGGTLRAQNNATWFLPISQDRVILEEGGLNFDATGGVSRVYGFSGTGALHKIGGGELILADQSSYSGGTYVHSGTMTVGLGTGQLVSTGNLTVGAVNGDDARFTVDFGTLNSTGAYLGASAGSTGIGVLRTGTWQNYDLVVGQAGNGQLQISIGLLSTQYASVGSSSGGWGHVQMNSGTWNNAHTLYVGENGTGGVTVVGGTLNTGETRLGDGLGSFGSVTVSGSGSWNANGDVRVGTSGTGVVQVYTGGVISTTGQMILASGTSHSSFGNLTVTGGHLNVGGDIYFAGQGPGNMDVNAGGVVDTGGEIVSIANAHILLTGTTGARGTIRTTRVTSSGGMDTFTFDGGQLTAKANESQFLSGFNLTPVLINAGGAYIDSNGFAIGINSDLHGSGGLTKLGLGTLTLIGANTYSGGTTVESGTLQIGNGGSTGALPGNVHNDGVLVINRTGTMTPGVISGTGSLIKRAAGTLVLNGTNSYSGGTTVEGGTLTMASIESIGSGNIHLNGGTIHSNSDVNTSKALTLGSNGGGIEAGVGFFTLQTAISGSGALTKSGGLVTLTGHQTYLGNTTIQSGILKINSGSLDSPQVSISGSSTLLFSNNGSLAGNIVGSGTLMREFSGATVLTGSTANTIHTVVSSGTLQIGNGGATGDLSGDISNSGVVVVNRTGTMVSTGVISGTGSLLKQAAGTLVLNGSNSYGGGTTIEGGTLAMASIESLGSGNLHLNGGTIRNNSNVNTAKAVTLGLNGGGIEAGVGFFTLQTAISGSGALTKSGGLVTLTGHQTYLGNTTIQSGMLKINEGSLSSPLVTINHGGTLLLSTNGSLAGNIVGSGTLMREFSGATVLTGSTANTIHTVVSSGTLQIGNGGATGDLPGDISNSGVVVFNRTGTAVSTGVISGTGSLQKQASGTVVLSGSNSYTGATTIESGRLIVNGNQSAATGLVTVKNGATLGGSGVLGGAVIVESGGRLGPGNSPGQLTLESDLTLGTGSLLEMEFAGTEAGQYDQLDVQGIFIAGGTLHLSIIGAYVPVYGDVFTIFNGQTPGFTSGSFTLTTNLGGGLTWDTSRMAEEGIVEVVPEPSTWVLMGIGAFAVALAVHRRRGKKIHSQS